MNSHGDERQTRQTRERSGHSSELIAAALLLAKGYRILARRFTSHAGEIDLIAIRTRKLIFVEVKRRQTLAACHAAITPRQRQRIRRAADLWLAANARYRDREIAFDVVFVTPFAWPRHIPDGL